MTLDPKALRDRAIRINQRGGLGYETHDFLNDITAYLAALPSTAGEPVRVKPLEWKWQHDKLDEAETVFGRYSVRLENDGSFWWEFRGYGIEGRGLGFEDCDEAKTAAQADFDARIRSALSTLPLPPVAPQGRGEAERNAVVEAAIKDAADRVAAKLDWLDPAFPGRFTRETWDNHVADIWTVLKAVHALKAPRS